MSAALTRGWCPSLFEPMASGDGLIVRIKPPLGRLTAEAARALADASRRFGNGRLGLTQRANLQLRGISEAALAPLTALALELRLADPDPAFERRRNIIVSPLLGADPAIAGETRGFAEALAAGLRERRFDRLPGKFGFLVDGGGWLALPRGAADVALTYDDSTWRVWPGGAAATDPVDAALRIAAEADGRLPRLADETSRWVGRRGAVRGFAAPFGMLTPASLLAAAAAAGDGLIRLAPWQGLLIARAAAGDVAGLIDDPDDPRLAIAACAGHACTRAEADAQGDAASLAARPDFAPRGAVAVHVSGCAKGCAHPGAAGFTLTGIAGRYDLVRNGRASDPPAASGLTLDEAARLMAAS